MRHQRFLARLPHCASPRIDLHGKARTTVGVCSWRVLSASRTRPISAVRHAKQRAHGERDERQSPTALSTSTSSATRPTASSTTQAAKTFWCGCSHRHSSPRSAAGAVTRRHPHRRQRRPRRQQSQERRSAPRPSPHRAPSCQRAARVRRFQPVARAPRSRAARARRSPAPPR